MKRRVLSYLVVLFLFVGQSYSSSITVSANTATYTNWPLLRVDHRNTGFTTASFPTTMEFDEFLPIQSQRPPIVANNQYYLVEFETGTVHCYDVSTQNLIWKKKYSTVTNVNILMGNGCIFSEATNQLLLLETIEGNWDRKTGFVSCVYALDPNTGSIHWKKEIKGYYANSMTASDNEVFVKVIEIRSSSQSNYLSIQNRVYSFDLVSGQMNWSSELLKGGEGYWSFNAPAFNDRYIAIPSTNCVNQNPDGTITAVQPCYMTLLDRHTGRLLDTIIMDDFVGTSMPLFVEDKIYVISTLSGTGELPNYLFCLSTSGNRLRQSYRLLLSDERHDYIYNVNLAKYKDYIYFLDYSGSLLCLSTNTGRIEWRQKVGERSWVGPYFCNEDYIIICTVHRVRSEQSRYNYDNHIKVQYIDPENGKELFSNSVLFDGYPPHHLSGTEDHIWAICGRSIAHFTPKEVLAMEITPLEIRETAWEGDTDRFVNLVQVQLEGNVTGSIFSTETWIQCDSTEIYPELSTVKVYIDPSDKKAGHYSGAIHFHSNAGDATVSVRLDVFAHPQLEIVPGSVELTVYEGTRPDATTFYVHNKGGSGLDGAIHGSEDWLQISHNTIDDRLTKFTVQYETENKPSGDYKASILVISNGGKQTIPIVVHILATPFLEVTPKEIIQEVAIGSSSLLDIFLRNTGGKGLKGSISSNQEWLLLGTSHYDDDTEKIVCTLDARSLKAGTYEGAITFAGNDQQIIVPVTLHCIVWITLQIGSKTIEVNKVDETIAAAPYLFEKRTYVPVRKLVESLPILHYLKNTELKWDDQERKVTIYVGEKTIELWVDNPVAKMNGQSIQIDPDNIRIAPQIQEGRTFLPLRFVAENLGYKVEWIAPTQTIHLKYHVSNELSASQVVYR